MLAFSYKPFLLYFTTNSLSLLGLWMQKVGVGWLTWQITESTFWTSFVTLALMVPAGILGPFFCCLGRKLEYETCQHYFKVCNVFDFYIYIYFTSF